MLKVAFAALSSWLPYAPKFDRSGDGVMFVVLLGSGRGGVGRFSQLPILFDKFPRFSFPLRIANVGNVNEGGQPFPCLPPVKLRDIWLR
jgi:hypothetical protein